MNTEITDNEKSNGWVCYDADVRGLCASGGTLPRSRWQRRFFSNWSIGPPKTGCIRLEGSLLAEMRLLKPDGAIVGGADALIEISRQFLLGLAVCGNLAAFLAVMNFLRACLPLGCPQRRWLPSNGRVAKRGPIAIALREKLAPMTICSLLFLHIAGPAAAGPMRRPVDFHVGNGFWHFMADANG